LPRSITEAQPALEFIPPNLNGTVLWGMQQVLPMFTRMRTTIADVEAQNVEALVDLYRQFQDGKVRFIMAFRHPSADDPICLAHLLWRHVPRVARQQGIALKPPLHAHFIYDRGIPIWGGRWLGWLYSNLGGTPVHRGRMDRTGLRSIRDLFANGVLPMAAAPEGATNGHTEIISPLEPGVAQMGFWCVEDLQKTGRTEQVYILPIGIRYRYLTPPWDALEQLIGQLEQDTGLPAGTTHPETRQTDLYQRLYRLGQHLLVQMEEFYIRFYHQPLPTPAAAEATTTLSNEAFADRLNTLLDVALKVAEQYFALEPKGSVIDRCRRLEQAGWDYIYREDIKDLDSLPPLTRGLADRVAEEADLRIWHMRMVESFVAVTGKYVQEKPSVERFAETTLLMWDMIARIKDENPFNRPKLGSMKALLTVGEPISVSDRWEAYQGGRRNARQAITDLTQAIQAALEQMIAATA